MTSEPLTYAGCSTAPGLGRYLYVRCHMDALQANLDLRAGQGYRVHTITHSGSLVHVLFDRKPPWALNEEETP